jgi:hypothetical protein
MVISTMHATTVPLLAINRISGFGFAIVRNSSAANWHQRALHSKSKEITKAYITIVPLYSYKTSGVSNRYTCFKETLSRNFNADK